MINELSITVIKNYTIIWKGLIFRDRGIIKTVSCKRILKYLNFYGGRVTTIKKSYGKRLDWQISII